MLLEKVQKKFALTKLGAENLIKACISCTISYIVIAMSIGVLYFFTCDMLKLLADKSYTFSVGVYIAEFVVVFALIYIAHYIQYNMTFLNTYTESARLRINVAEKLRKFPMSFFSKRDLSDLTTTILSDVTYMEQALSHFIPEFVGSIASTVLLSIGMFMFDFKMALAAVWCVPVSIILILLAKKKLSSVSHKDRDIQLIRTEKIQEGLETVRDLKASNYTEQYLKEVDDAIDNCEKSQIKAELTNALFVVSSQLVLRLGIATVVIFGVKYLMAGQITLEVFMLFLIVASRLYDPLNATLQNLAAIISCESRVDRLNNINDYKLQTGGDTFEPENYDIEFEDVSFSYQPGKPVLDDVSFTAKQNEITALIGNSGGGKTTCASLIARFYDLDKGKIKIGGVDIATVDPEVLLSKFSIVFQDVVLFNNTIFENIRIGKKDATDEEVIAAAKLANAHGFIKHLKDGYNTVLTGDGSNLSQGQRQLLSIARTAIANPPVLILDEATSNVDMITEQKLQQAMNTMMEGRTSFVIAHRLKTIINSDKIVVIKDGKVVEEGTHKDLLSLKGFYNELYQNQFSSLKGIVNE